MRIACIGNITFDCIVRCERFIKEGFKNNFYGAEYSTGGPASNASYVIKKFGADVDFYGRVGNDPFGDIVKNQINSEGIDITHVKTSNKIITPNSFIIVSNDKRTICSVRSEEERNNPTTENTVFESGYDYILTDGKYPLDTLKLKKNNPNAITIIDAGRTDKKILELCDFMDYIICSEEFANEVTGKTINSDMSNYKEIYQILKKKYPNAKGITITVGSKGYICEKNHEVVNMPAYNSGLDVIDTTGAGDIFHGAFTYALANNNDYYEALEFANVCASLSTSKIGGRSSVPELREVNDAMKVRVKKLKK